MLHNYNMRRGSRISDLRLKISTTQGATQVVWNRAMQK